MTDMTDRLDELAEQVIARVQALMTWDREKAHLWLKTPNPHFGNTTPEHLIQVGRAHKVLTDAFGEGERA